MVQQSLNPNETIIAEASDGTKLVVYREYEEVDAGDPNDNTLLIYLPELDHAPGAIRFVDEDPEVDAHDVEYQFREARIAFGLWLRCGPFNQPEGRAVPYEIATDGQDAITAYVHLNNGYPLAREATASICGVEEQTVSDRLSRVRWRPDQQALPEGSE